MSTVHCPVCGELGRHLYEKGGHQIHRCRGCGLGFVADLPAPEELERFYADSYYERAEGESGGLGYHTAYGELEPGLKRMYGDHLDEVGREHPGRRFDRVLDFIDFPRQVSGLTIDRLSQRFAMRDDVTFFESVWFAL